MSIIKANAIAINARSGLPIVSGTCDSGDCARRAVSFAYDDRISALIPVCRRHILVYSVSKPAVWQAEDEYAELRFARRSRWRWLAQWRVLADQRAAVKGRESQGQRRKRVERDRAADHPNGGA